jgi:hypothetical protein
MAEVVNTFWSNDHLPQLDIACMATFKYHDHPVHIWSHTPIKNLPSFVVNKDANEVLGKSWKIRLNDLRKYSDLFRYSLLSKIGGWWVDTDQACFVTWNFSSEYVFARDAEVICNGVLRLPSRDFATILRDEATALLEKDPKADIGPYFLNDRVYRHNLQKYAQDPAVFIPIYYKDRHVICQGGWNPPPNCVGVHIYGWARYQKKLTYQNDSPMGMVLSIAKLLGY